VPGSALSGVRSLGHGRTLRLDSAHQLNRRCLLIRCTAEEHEAAGRGGGDEVGTYAEEAASPLREALAASGARRGVVHGTWLGLGLGVRVRVRVIGLASARRRARHRA
jgi:hypothetical protein